MISAALSASLAAQTSTLANVQETGPRGERINIVFLGDGYTSAEMPNFATHVDNAVNSLFSQEPWTRYRSYCNVYRIEIASNQSGCDNGNTGGPGIARDTYFNTGFNTSSVPQLLTLDNAGSTKAYNLLNSRVPEYDVPIILVNDTKYGGSGGAISVASMDASSAQIVEHEIGHSFAFLADEYDDEYPGYTPYERANNTAQTVRELIRWNHWIDAATPAPTPETSAYDNLAGLFEGSMYRTTGWYRPHNNSLMRNLNRPCGQINREQFVLQIYNRVHPLDGQLPASTNLSFTGPNGLSFSVSPKVPASGPGISVVWKVDGTIQPGQAASSFSTLSDFIGNGSHTVSATASDTTDFVRLDTGGMLKQTITWNVNLSGQIPADLAGWRSAYGSDNTILTGDQLPNLVKYSLGLAANVAANNAQRPTGSIADVSGQSHLTLTVPRRLKRGGISYVVDVSNDLKTWNSGAGHTVTVQDTDTLLVVRDAMPQSGQNRRFIRLRVAAP
jgi:hypothetical protein